MTPVIVATFMMASAGVAASATDVARMIPKVPNLLMMLP
jgi:hypothetical protein